MEERTDIDGLRRLLTGLVGAPVAEVHVPPTGGGAFGLRLRLPALRWLGVNAVAWRLDRLPAAAGDGQGAVLAASGDREGRLAADLAVLTGREITSVELLAPGWEAHIRFGELELTVFPLYHRTPDALPDWTLRLPSHRLLVAGPGPRWAVTG
ncbi:hypothetical protein ACFYNO_11745 [Kitasatospora sp. NPDC006697]|uniref:hypothetical protein n=1 Tax=Kitasatospora sp. NPDC006697 TaxID=3364020 RepID=UPI0036B7050F